MAESMRADAHQKANMDTFEAYGKGRSWESAFRSLNQAIELIYLMCELESSVVFVEHAERVFSEASQDFKELKLRISDQLLFQSYIEESPGEDIDHLSIAWDVPSFKLDYSRHLPDEAATPGCSDLLQSDRFVARGSSPLAPFPSKQMNEEKSIDSDVRAASTGALIDEKEPLVLWSEACVVTPQRMRRPRATSENACLDSFSPESQPGPRLAARHLRPRLNSSPQSTGAPQFSPGTISAGNTARRGASAVATPGGRSLHHKLMSPERFKRDPAETRRVADEKQQRAERLRSGLEAERKAKLEKAKQEREAVRSLKGELQQVRQQEQRARHALSQERRKVLLHGIVARATDESEKVKEVQFIRQLEADSSRAALEARLERGGVRRREKLAMRQLRNGREVDFVLEDAQRRKQAREQARMEELFEKLQKKEEAIAKLEVERRKGRTTPATDGDSVTSNPQSTLESPAADGSTTSATETPKQRRERLELERAQEKHTALEKRLQEATERRTQMLNATRNAATSAGTCVATTTPTTPVAKCSAPVHTDGSTPNNEVSELKPAVGEKDPHKDCAAAGNATHAKHSKAQTADASSHVQRETWAGRVLRSRGVKGGEAAKSSAMYNHILKSLRTKASKLRKRLSVDPCTNVEAFSGLSGCDETARMCDGDESASLATDRVSPATGCTSDTSLLHHYSHLATAVSTAIESQSPKALMHALAAIGHVSTWPMNPPEAPCNMSSPAAESHTRASQYTCTLKTQQYCNLAQSSGLLRTVAEALVSTATCSQMHKHSADASSHVWPVETVVAAATTLMALTQSAESRLAALNFPCIVGLVDSIRIHLDSAIECINPGPPSTRSTGREGVKTASSQPPEPHTSTPQHPAAVSCMAALIQLLQCYPQSQETRCRRCDVISYALAAGLVYRIAHFFLLMHGSMGEAAVVPAAVRHSMQLLELLSAADPRAVLSAAKRSRGAADNMVCLRVKSIQANLVTMARDTSLMGLLSLLSASLLPAATASSRGPAAMIERPPDDPQHQIVSRLAVTELLPDDLLPSALSALRTINGMLLLALQDMQSLLTAPDLSAELLFVLALVLSLCSARWPGDDGVVALLLHEAVLLLGLYSSGSPDHQHKLCWGPAPSLLQRLCAVPSQYLHTTPRCSFFVDTPQPPTAPRETVVSHVFLDPKGSAAAEHAESDTTLPLNPFQLHPVACGPTMPDNGPAARLMIKTSCAPSESETVETEYDTIDSSAATAPITCSTVSTSASDFKDADKHASSSTATAMPSGPHHPILERRHSSSNGSQCTCTSGQQQGSTDQPHNTSHSGSQAPVYLQHILYPTLLASCLDAPRNFQAVIHAIGSQGILDYCTAHAPPPVSPHFAHSGTPNSVGSPRHPQCPPLPHHHHAQHQHHPSAVSMTLDSPRSFSASGRPQRPAPVSAHLDSNPSSCPQAVSGVKAAAVDGATNGVAGAASVAASVGDVSASSLCNSHIAMQVSVPEWHVDLGPLDGRFHPQHRIQASSWWRAYDQLLAAAGISGNVFSGNSTSAHVHDVSVATYHPT